VIVRWRRLSDGRFTNNKDGMMHEREIQPSDPRARPILSERDYNAAKLLLAEHAQALKPYLEAGRFQSLIRELGRYETLPSSKPAGVLVRVEAADTGSRDRPQRRWTDTPRWHGAHAA
jgi:hypothetical protein